MRRRRISSRSVDCSVRERPIAQDEKEREVGSERDEKMHKTYHPCPWGFDVFAV